MQYHRSRHFSTIILFLSRNIWRRILVGALKGRLTLLVQEYVEHWEIKILAVEIMPEHVPLLLSTPPTLVPCQIAHDIKGWTSYVLRQEFPFLKRYKAFWSGSYFVGSSGNVSSLRDTLRRANISRWETCELKQKNFYSPDEYSN